MSKFLRRFEFITDIVYVVATIAFILYFGCRWVWIWIKYMF